MSITYIHDTAFFYRISSSCYPYSVYRSVDTDNKDIPCVVVNSSDITVYSPNMPCYNVDLDIVIASNAHEENHSEHQIVLNKVTDTMVSSSWSSGSFNVINCTFEKSTTAIDGDLEVTTLNYKAVTTTNDVDSIINYRN